MYLTAIYQILATLCVLLAAVGIPCLIFCFILLQTFSYLRKKYVAVREMAHLCNQEKSGSYMRRAFIKVIEFELRQECEIPFYLVNAYLYVTNCGKVYEVDPYCNTLIRTLYFDPVVQLITIEHHTVFGTNYTTTSKLVDHPTHDSMLYYNYLPPSVKIPKRKVRVKD